ncbi:RNA polymerase recycling motor ATPase HelR [Cellulomonas sp. NPDC089187]|uniref:RNA polymerase recycling motor ATPase HelR n=1 Tax=Cellulomonas sp. NPDC089187 TaxID=3154970 RepID=UPI003443A9E3
MAVFALPDTRAAKADPALIADDQRHFDAIAATLADSVADLTERLDAARRAPGVKGTAALERDQEIHRLSARLRLLRRFGLDLCLGRMLPADGADPVYVGRIGLTDPAGRRLLVDWRSPVAEPFFGATHADPMGLTSRRRYRWTGGQISDYWDEVFDAEQWDGSATLDDQSAFIASLAGSRSERMRDVLGTIQADQDAIIRAGSAGALVVDGGPGTGKTVVALHRTAYLLYADPRLGHRRGGALFVGPSRPYLSYVGDVLPSLGEEGVSVCTLRDLVPEGAAAVEETDPAAALKADRRMVDAVDPAVRFYQRPPRTDTVIETPTVDLVLTPADWAEAIDGVEPGTPHNEARDQVRDGLLAILVDRAPQDVTETELRRALREPVRQHWPLLDPEDLVADLWEVPAYLHLCAPWLTAEQRASLRRDDPRAWTVADLPLLDAARTRLGDPEASRRAEVHHASVAADRARMADVIDDLIAADDSTLGVMHMLRGDDLRSALVHDAALPVAEPDQLAGPFAHVVVDEAQELTDAQWQMLIARCPSRSFTVVGDRAQARHGFAESWTERLRRVGLDRVEVASLTVNYRTPAEVMAEAERVIRAALPEANVPTSVRESGRPVRHGVVAELDAVVDGWLATHDGIAGVIGAPDYRPTDDRVRSLTPEQSKGLEFDLVVVVDPADFGSGIEGAVDRYVAMTRATGDLVVLADQA